MPFIMPMHDIKKLLEKYVAGTCTPAERLLIEQWYEQESDRSKVDTTQLNFDQLEANIWQQVQLTISPPPKRLAMTRSVLLKIAAAFLLLLGAATMLWLAWPPKEEWQEVIAAKGKPLQFMLEDGTQVWLNAGSQLRYPAQFQSTSRQIELITGEICLDVKQDPARPFFIKSGQINTRVLGTIFNVRAYSQLAYLQVTVQQGKVAVQCNKELSQLAGQEVIVLPGEQVTVHTQSPEICKTTVDATAVNKWTTGQLLFNNERLDMISLMLENKYNVDISFDDPALQAYRITAGIEATDTLADVLNALCLANKLKYSTQGHKITISKQIH